MMNNFILKTTQAISEAIPKTINCIAKINEIKRSCGITKRQAKRMLLENETNMQIAESFQQFCKNNPGILYVEKIGNQLLCNINQILDFAQQEFTENEIIQDTLNEEWIMRFLDISGLTCDIEKQKVLGKVLSGELKKPDSISYRTLEVLKNLTKNDIELFKKGLQFSLTTGLIMFIPQNDAALNYGEVLHLSECGLMSSNPTTNYNPKSTKLNLYTFNKEHILLVKSKNDENISLSCYTFTEAAEELSQLIKLDLPVFPTLKNSLKDYSNKYDLALYKIMSINNEVVLHSTENMLV